MEKEELLRQILDGSNQIIQVSELDTYHMLYANQPAQEYAKQGGQTYQGEACYKYMMGRDEPCPFCPLRQMEDLPEMETEIYNGQQFFAVKTKLTEWNGKKAFIEYARDITDIRRMEEAYHSQVSAVMISVREAEMVFHVDLTDDKLINKAGLSYKVGNLRIGSDIDSLIAKIGVYVVDEIDRARFLTGFDRASLKKAYEKGDAQISIELDALYNDDTIRPSRVVARMFFNPTNNHVECILYGIDISEELRLQLELKKAYEEQTAQLEEITILNSELAQRQTQLEKYAEEQDKQVKEISELNRRLKTVLDNYKEADYDRRRDFLTGLRNRQDMFELLQDVLSGKRENITSMFMMDIDNFKMLNDHYGHEYGDDCLKKLGAILNEYGEKNEIKFYRYGGEEILGICFNKQEKAITIAEELLQIVRDQKIKREDVPLGIVTISLGYTTDNRRYEKMVDQADKAMYQAKENGKNRSFCFEDMQ